MCLWVPFLQFLVRVFAFLSLFFFVILLMLEMINPVPLQLTTLLLQRICSYECFCFVSTENYDKASEILNNLEKLVPNMLQVAYRRINLERRCNNMDKVCALYEHYISNTKNKVISNNMAIKYARFCWKVS